MNKHRIYALLDLATKLMVINFLWFLSVLSGFIVFTIFPATEALFICVERQLRSSLAYSEITKYFFKNMFENFAKFSVIGLVFTFFFLILSSNFIFIYNYRNVLIVKMLLQPIMIFIGILGVILFMNIFMVNVYEKTGFKGLMKTSVKNGLRYPFNGIARGLILGAVIFVLIMLPGLLPIISMNVVAVASVWIFPKPNNLEV